MCFYVSEFKPRNTGACRILIFCDQSLQKGESRCSPRSFPGLEITFSCEHENEWCCRTRTNLPDDFYNAFHRITNRTKQKRQHVRSFPIFYLQFTYSSLHCNRNNSIDSLRPSTFTIILQCFWFVPSSLQLQHWAGLHLAWLQFVIITAVVTDVVVVAILTIMVLCVCFNLLVDVFLLFNDYV